MNALIPLAALLCGLIGLIGLVERTEPRWLRRMCGAGALMGLLTAGFCGREAALRIETQRIATQPSEAQPKATDSTARELIASQRIGAQTNAAKPDGTLRLAADRSLTERWERVQDEIGPPPSPDAVPVLGYVTTSGVRYPSRWRTPPNADTSDNLKQ